MSLEELNYWNDSRVQASLRGRAYDVIVERQGHARIQLSDAFIDSNCAAEVGIDSNHDGIIECSIEYAVCDCCHGRGKVVNPSIDAGGLTAEAFEEDPDFYDRYMEGAYDVTCPECNGLRVVPKATIRDEKIAKAVAEWEADQVWIAQELARERAMGY